LLSKQTVDRVFSVLRMLINEDPVERGVLEQLYLQVHNEMRGIRVDAGQPKALSNGTLLDQVADILLDPRAGSMLSGQALTRMRDLLLLPEEQIRIKQQLEPLQGCPSCGRLLGDRVLVAHYNGKVHCLRCVMPVAVPCAIKGCNETVAMPDAVLRQLGKQHLCANHKGSSVEQQASGGVYRDVAEAAWGIPGAVRRPR